MDLDDNYLFRGSCDVSAIAELVETVPEHEWLDSVARIAPVHRASRGVFLKNDLATEHLYGTIHPAFARFRDALAPVLDGLREQIDAGYFIRLQLSRHLPGTGFDPHVDVFSFTLTHSHRIHIPIVTNDDVWFSVGGERKVMKRGEAWEINNVRTHAGHNGGTTQRIHLIVDRAVPLSRVTDRVAYALNRLATGTPMTLLGFRPQLAGEPAPRPMLQLRSPPPPARDRVEPDTLVAVRMTITDAATGAVLLDDRSAEPQHHVHGRAQLPPRFDAALAGLRPGTRFAFIAPPDEAFGQRDSKLVARVNAGMFGELPRRDMYAVDGTTPFIALVTAGDERTHVIDANHPLAGRTLEVTGVVEHIRALDREEYAHAVFTGPTFATGFAARRAVDAYVRAPDSFDVIDVTGRRHHAGTASRRRGGIVVRG